MVVECPECKTSFNIDDSKLPSDGIKLRCAKCRTVFKVEMQAAGAAGKPPSAGYRVLIANGDPEVCEMMENVLKGENMTVLKAYDGVEALNAAENHQPHVIVLDVAIPKIYGFVVCEFIRKKPELKDTKIILMASIFDKMRYKRNPNSLYGADDYIEKHHIHDDLVPKIHALLVTSGPEATGPKEPEKAPAAVSTRVVAPPRASDEDIAKLKASEEAIAQEDGDVKEKAKKLARIVVSDIILYNSEEVDFGVANDNIYKVLRDDIKDGIRYMKERTPGSVPVESYLKEALDEFLSRKREEINTGL
ncbi:MAG: response regulator [Thermodesulfobacteriota bacterium]